ncbi:uncharacterized protein METZ01_LOCUS500183 [marine metagenome]|uniref:Uncharacterized protein n=1 Tax=marine metagenome TaxID=408172 RepID=A0A383DSQ8_9ZZZZ
MFNQLMASLPEGTEDDGLGGLHPSPRSEGKNCIRRRPSQGRRENLGFDTQTRQITLLRKQRTPK